MSVVRCPTCGQAFEIEQSQAPPFCSSRCRQIDLGRWLDETNSVSCEPSEDKPPNDHEPSEN